MEEKRLIGYAQGPLTAGLAAHQNQLPLCLCCGTKHVTCAAGSTVFLCLCGILPQDRDGMNLGTASTDWVGSASRCCR
jgi:hypothetical protein